MKIYSWEKVFANKATDKGVSIFFFFILFLFLNFTNCISFAKYQNESATGIHNFMAAVTICSDFGAPKNKV